MSMRKKLAGIAVLLVLLAAVVVLVWFPPSFGRLPKMQGEKPLSEKIEVQTASGKLGAIILSKNTDNPVLLVCGGGPGIPQYLLESLYASPLTDVFTVCYWDYWGTGLSYKDGIAASEMTSSRYLDDTLRMTDYVADRFSRGKICIMGHSFGTYIALKTVQRHPEKYTCYIAMAQIVNQEESERIAFDYMKAEYEKAGNTRMVSKFNAFDLDRSQEALLEYCASGLRDKAMHEVGIGTARNMRSVVGGIFFPSLRCKAYTQSERIHIWQGKILSNRSPVSRDSWTSFNAVQDVPALEVPVYFLVGNYDYTCCALLQVQYYKAVKAPDKALFRFEQSAHSPLYEEPDRGRRVLEEIVERTR
jgi:pimeloyl-ACP methyl ester carboxylesterase